MKEDTRLEFIRRIDYCLGPDGLAADGMDVVSCLEDINNHLLWMKSQLVIDKTVAQRATCDCEVYQTCSTCRPTKENPRAELD